MTVPIENLAEFRELIEEVSEVCSCLRAMHGLTQPPTDYDQLSTQIGVLCGVLAEKLDHAYGAISERLPLEYNAASEGEEK